MNGTTVGDAEKSLALVAIECAGKDDPSLETIDHRQGGRRCRCCRRPFGDTLSAVGGMHLCVSHLHDHTIQRQTFSVCVHPQRHGGARTKGCGEKVIRRWTGVEATD